MSLWLLLIACGPDESPKEAPVDHLTAEALEEATRALTDLGPRMVATPAEERARAVVEELFIDAGLSDVHSEGFTFDAWNPGVATLEVGGQSFAIEALSPSPSVQVTAPLAGQEDDFTDAIVVMSDDTGGRTEHYFSATLGGAAALIRITEVLDFDGSPLVEVGHTLDGSTFPSAAVDALTGDILEASFGEEATLTIDPVIAVDHQSYNVVGKVPGDGSGTVYLVAHYDSWHPSESAFDNAIGVAAQVLLARQLVQAGKPDRDVVFIATSGEEQGLQGAFAYAEAHAAEIGPEDLVLTLDVLWSGEGTFYAEGTRQDLVDDAIAAVEAEGLEVVDGGDPGIGSDHFPLVLYGAQAIWCIRAPDRHYHTTEDTIEHLDMDEGAAATRAQWTLLADAVGL